MKITKQEKKQIKEWYTKIKNKKKVDLVIYGTRNHNILKSFGLEIERGRTGEYNGYGYERLPNAYIYNSSDNKIWKKMIAKIEKVAIKKLPKTRSPKEKIESWCKRLSLLSGISIEEAKKIAQEKIDYYDTNVEKRFSSAQAYEPRGSRYPAWVKQAEKDYYRFYNDESVALKRITDEEHAFAILSASNRHNNTDYESRLEEGKELAKIGDIDKSEVKEYARENKVSYEPCYTIRKR